MGKGTSGTQTVVQQSSPPSAFLDAYQQLLGRATNAADRPLNQYPLGSDASNLVAGFSPDQENAMGIVAGAQGMQMPFINRAAQSFEQGSRPFWMDVGNYESPYTNDVVNATQRQFNEQNAQAQQGLIGNAVKSGAWGGDRSAVAQGILAGQQQMAQAPIIAGLRDQGYARAMQAAQAQAGLANQAGAGFGNLGQEALSTTLAGANSLLGTGILQQQQKQNQINAAYQQFREREAYPFQTTGWLANIGLGLGAGAGGTGSSTSAINPSGLATGLGTAATGAGILGQTGAFGNNGWLTNWSGWNSGGGATANGLGSNWFGAASPSDPLAGGAIPTARGGRITPRRFGGGIVANDNDRWVDERATGTYGPGIVQRRDWGGAVDDDLSGLWNPDMADTTVGRAAAEYGPGIMAAGDDYALNGEAGVSGLTGDAGGDDLSRGYTGRGIASADRPMAGILPRYAVDFDAPQASGRSAEIRDRAPWLALTGAGLGILGTGNIGRGGLKGLEIYSDQLDRANQVDEREGQRIDTGKYRKATLQQSAAHLSDQVEQARQRLEQSDRHHGDTVNYQNRHLDITEENNRALRAQAAASLAETRRSRLETEAFHRGQLDQGKYHYTPWQKPDPDDPNKLVTGLMRTSVKPGEPPVFIPTEGAPLPKDMPPGMAGAGPRMDTHGTEYLKTLPGNTADQVKALAEGRMQFPGAFALKTPYWQNMLNMVAQYDPEFDQVNYAARGATRKSFASGKDAENVASINTTIGHMGTLLDSAEKLDNTWSPAFNTVANWVAGQKGDPRIKEFNIAREAVANELTKVFRGTGASEGEIQRWNHEIDSAGSPQQLRGAVKQGMDLLHSRLDAVGEKYRKGMGTTADPMELLTKKAKDTLQKLDERLGIESGSRTDAPPAGAPEGYSQPVTNQAGQKGWKNPATGKIWIE